jgi:hypothetical protein
MTTLIVWRLMEAPLGTSRLARLLESYRLATKQPPPPGLVLVHTSSAARRPRTRRASARGGRSRPRRSSLAVAGGPTLVTITASTELARSFGATRHGVRPAH